MEHAKRLAVRVGEEVELKLPANPSTGYLWEASVDRPGLQVSKSRFQPSKTGVGGGGQQVFGLTAQGKGQYVIRLTYKRPWEVHAAEEDLYVITAEE